MEVFLKFDLFTVNSFFQYQSNRKVPSFPGLFFSIIAYGFLLYTFFKSDMVQKTNPKISDIIISNTDLNNGMQSDFDFSSEDFRITIYNFNVSAIQYFDPQFWKLEFYLWDYSYGAKTPLSLVNCTSQNGSLCMNASSKISSNNNSFISIRIRICENSSDVICKPAEEIYDFVLGVQFQLEFKETLFDLNNYNHPVEDKYFIKVYAVLNKNFAEYYEFNIMPVEFTESKNVFEEEKQGPIIYYQQDYTGLMSTFYHRTGNHEQLFNYLLGINIGFSADKRVISRNYQGFSEIMGQLGGLLSVLRLFGGLVLSIFPYLRIRRRFIKKFYDIPDKKQISKEEILRKKSTKLKNVELVSHDFSKFEKNKNGEIENEQKFENSICSFHPMIPLSTYLQKDDENHIEKDIRNEEKNKIPEQLEKNEKLAKKNKLDLLKCLENLKTRIDKIDVVKSLNFSFCNYLKNKIKSLLRMKVDSEGETILAADKIYEKETDIILLLKRIRDIDKLKCVLLNKEQKILFDLIKPGIMITAKNSSTKNLSDFSEVMLKSLDIEQNPKEIHNVLRVYEEKIKGDDGEINDIDRNLLEYFKE